MDPRTFIEWIDESDISPLQDISGDNSPVFFYAITSDKGPEDLRLITAADFSLYGEPNFKRHGQPQLQAKRSLDSGAKVLIQRVVASDATLANVIISAKITVTEVQKKNSQGIPLYLDQDGKETTEAEDNTAIMINVATLKLESSSVTGASDINAVSAQAMIGATDDNFPIFSIVDTGRGVSNKRIRLAPDYNGSKNLSFMLFAMDILENNSKLETIKFGMNPDNIYNFTNYSLEYQVNSSSKQIKSVMYDTQVEALIEKIAESLEISVNEVYSLDILNGKDKTGKILQNLVIDPTSINLSNVFGVELGSGTNGDFGNAPKDATTYGSKLAKVYTGELSNEVFDLTKYQISAIIDANYPSEVKRAIESLVSFREDSFYFRDLGIISTLDGIKLAHAAGAANKFIGSYHISYDIIDPGSMKQITVTSNYTLAKLLVDHMINRINRPIAGELFGMILNDAIQGTINFIPVLTPTVNQREMLGDARINYASYYGDKLILETQFTSQPKHTQYSYINNVLLVQQLIRKIRLRCPKTRYSFMTGTDLENYKKDVETVISEDADKFKFIEFEYIEDQTMIQNKVFYATIRVSFNDYIEAEYFKVIAIN